jgi:hypothetical protein
MEKYDAGSDSDEYSDDEETSAASVRSLSLQFVRCTATGIFLRNCTSNTKQLLQPNSGGRRVSAARRRQRF